MQLLRIVEQAEELKKLTLEMRDKGDNRPYREILEELLKKYNKPVD